MWGDRARLVQISVRALASVGIVLWSFSGCEGGGAGGSGLSQFPFGPQNQPPFGTLEARDLKPLGPQSIVGPSPRIIEFRGTFSDPENRLQSARMEFGDGTSLTLTASPYDVIHQYSSGGAQSVFWPKLILKDEAGQEVTIYVDNDQDFRIIVNPPLVYHLLNVVVDGQGTVKSEPAGINCPGDCSESYLEGSLVNLTRTPAEGWFFVNWGGNCAGLTETVPVKIDREKTCTAHFEQYRYKLNVNIEDPNQGRVTSQPAGINCPGDCTEEYASLTEVTLTASAEPGWLFEGWSEGCTGTDPVTRVKMTQDRTCSPMFALTHRLNVRVNGQGTVTSTPPGINCPGDCEEVYKDLTQVQLKAQPAVGWAFVNWSGDCTGTIDQAWITVNAVKECIANFAPIYPVRVTLNGLGTVKSEPPGIDCPGDCEEWYVVDSQVQLRSQASPGWAFAGWSGDCSGSDPTIEVSVTGAVNCTATFGPTHRLKVLVNGEGTVTSTPPGIHSPADPEELYLTGTAVELVAEPATGWAFANWSGDCSGANPSVIVVVDSDITCAANFGQLSYTLTLTIAGQGTVTSQPAGIDCPGDCSAVYLSNSTVNLTAASASGWVFSGWSGDCSGTSPVTSVLLSSDKSCVATFSQTPTLTVMLNGEGQVTSQPPGIDCPGDCSQDYLINTAVTLVAEPAGGWAFANWSGDCSGTNPTVQVTMDDLKTCVANFSQLSYDLNLTVTGQGAVTSNPAGINCPGDCSETYLSNSVITLMATASAGWEFSQWTGDCTGATSTIQVNLNGDKNCEATFTQVSYLVSVATVGNGTVTSTPAGIDCPDDCSELYLSFSEVTLTATPGPNFMFVSWSGDCSGTEPTTQLVVDRDKQCTANFTDLQYTLTVGVTGQGTVTDVPPVSINCPGDCTELYLAGTVVSLTATPAPGWYLANWTGDCSGTEPTIQVTMDADKTCTANFEANIYTLSVSITGNGTVTSDPTGIACPGDCEENYAAGTVVTLTAIPTPPYSFTGWSGDCSGTDPVTQVTITGDMNCVASFSECPPIIYSEDFEESDGGWTHGIWPGGPSDVVDTWHRANATCQETSLGSYAYGANGNRGPSCVQDSAHERSFAKSPMITLPAGCTTITLKFEAWSQDENGSCLVGGDFDRKDVGISTDNGATYTRLNQCFPLTTQNNVWQPWSFDISDWAGQDVWIMFVYDTIDEIIGAHFYVDDIQVVSP